MTEFQNQEVAEYVDGLADMQKDLVLQIREAVLAAGDQVKEGIKWGSIAFFNNKNICGYRVAKKHVTILFMEGASLEDHHGILAGDGAKARTYKVTEKDVVNQEALTDLVKQSLTKGF